jgi:hypothetical protein
LMLVPPLRASLTWVVGRVPRRADCKPSGEGTECEFIGGRRGRLSTLGAGAAGEAC